MTNYGTIWINHFSSGCIPNSGYGVAGINSGDIGGSLTMQWWHVATITKIKLR